MAKTIAVFPVLICLTTFLLPCPAAEPEERSKDRIAADFAADVLNVATQIHHEYFDEIPERELITWAVRGLYRRVLAGKEPIDLEERLRKFDDLNDEQRRALLADVRQDVERGRDDGPAGGLSDDRYLDLALEEMTRRLDPRTAVSYGIIPFRTPQRRFNTGLELRSEPATGFLRVLTPILDGPGYRAGVRAGDLITVVTPLETPYDGPIKDPKPIATKGLSLAGAMRHLTAERPLRVRLTVQRPGTAGPRECEFRLASVVKEGILGYRRTKEDRWDYWIDADRKIAYVRLAALPPQTAERFKAVIAGLRKDKAKGLILDLRFSPCGTLADVLEMAGLFIGDRIVTTFRRRGRVEETYRGKGEGTCPDLPLVCLINGESSNGAEVLAACLQDYRRAVIMGERSQGNGGLMDIILLALTGGRITATLRCTTGILYRPNGKKLNRAHADGTDDGDWGVRPDPGRELPLTWLERRKLAEHLERQTLILPGERYGKDEGPGFEDRQLEMAVAYLRGLKGKSS